MPRDRESITDILASIRLARKYVRDMDRESFDRDEQCQDAVIRRFEIMGEAAKRISDAARNQFPDIPWQEMAGMRDRVIHGYDTVDLAIVWDTIQKDLPALEKQLDEVLDSGLPSQSSDD